MFITLFSRLKECRYRVLLAALVALFHLCVEGGSKPSYAAEDGKGFYLLGSTTSMAGFVPPPGTYGTSYKYLYSGSASGTAATGVALDQLGNITLEADVDVDADIFVEVLTPMIALQSPVLGGTLAFGALVPIGWQDISADVDALAALTLPNGRSFQRGARFSLDDDTFAFGDPVALAMLGWHNGNWHWKVQGLLNIPIGDYSSNDLANMGFNRWGFDASGAVTWLDPARGHEVSVNAGFTFNGENPDTDYKTGTEFHAEFAVMQHFSKAFSAGVAGYYYDQVTGDSGRGAALGSFKGQVSAIGPNINYNFQWGQTPVSTSLRWFHEFDARNRLEGDAGYLVVTIPLGGRGG